MMQNKLPIGILKVDYSVALMGEDIVNSPKKAIATIANHLTGLTKESGFLLCMDIINRPICVGFLGTGDETTLDLSSKEIAQFALLTNAAGVVLIHNHPANGKKISSLRPSIEDVKVTEEISKTLQLFGVNLQDHIIVNYNWEEDKCSPAIYSMRSKRAYKNLFEHDLQQNSAYVTENVFSGVNILEAETRATTNELTNGENAYERNSTNNHTDYRDRPQIPSL